MSNLEKISLAHYLTKNDDYSETSEFNDNIFVDSSLSESIDNMSGGFIKGLAKGMGGMAKGMSGMGKKAKGMGRRAKKGSPKSPKSPRSSSPKSPNSPNNPKNPNNYN